MAQITLYKQGNRTVIEYHKNDKGTEELISKMGSFDIEINEEDERINIIDQTKPSDVINCQYSELLNISVVESALEIYKIKNNE